MCGVSFIDWNGSGQIDPQDIALTLAITESEASDDGDESDEDE